MTIASAPALVEVETVFQHLARSRLLNPAEIQSLRERWKQEGPPEAHGQRLCTWLVEKQYLTEYQSQAVLRGRVDHFFLNEYKLLDRIGQGKRAAVYRAVHRLGQVVAIKVLPPSKVKDAEAFARFQREARMALRVNHPNIVRTLQAGRFASLHYLVMEYLEGETLDALLQREKKLTPAVAADIMHQALQGLQHLHEQGIVHRDLNPGNLIIAPGDNGKPGTVKIVDLGFGLDIFKDENSPEHNAEVTKAGTILGSPLYMAPEQAVDAHASGIKGDIYALGCILHQMIAGQPPFIEKNIVKLIVRHASEVPMPLREFNPAVSDALQTIVNTMLAKDPAQRYATPGQAAEAVRAFLQSEAAPIAVAQPAQLLPSYKTWLDTTPACPEEFAPLSAEAVDLLAVVAAPTAEIACAIPYTLGPGEPPPPLATLAEPAPDSSANSLKEIGKQVAAIVGTGAGLALKGGRAMAGGIASLAGKWRKRGDPGP
jgi:serine/threonine protein kinase